MRYQLLAIDLDGTLLDDRGRVSEANRKAIAAAREAGAMVVPCTGRGWRESHAILRDVPELDTGVFVTGAVVAEVATGRSIDFSVIEPHLAHELVEHLRREPEAVLVYREAQIVGHDYLVTGEGTLTPETQWWFQMSGANVHFQRHVAADDLHHALRVGMVAGSDRLPTLTQRIAERFDGRIQMHHFPTTAGDAGSGDAHVLEIFADGVDKWRGLRWLAEAYEVSPDRIAAIGDQVNDVSMVRGAACGIAMGNAVGPLRDVADRVTEPNTEDGVARAIGRLLEGEW